MHKFIGKLLLVTAAIVAVPGAATASVTLVSVTPGTVPYTGPVPTYDFETPAPVTGLGLVTNTSQSGVRAQPLGSTGNYWTVGPTDGSPGILDLSSFSDIYDLSFIWGSVDSHNLIEFLAGDIVIGSFTGNAIFDPASGSQTDPNLNPVVRFAISGSDVSSLTSVRLSSTGNAFETDNFAINSAVPEPATWAMMLIGFGAMGVSMRRSRRKLGLLQAI
jgi:hypothetical protein